MERLLDFSQPLDVRLLDEVVNAFYQSHNQQAQEILVRFNAHPDAWTRVDAILERTTERNTRLWALDVLKDAISSRWAIIPVEQRTGIRSYIVNLIIKLAADPNTLRSERAVLTRLNIVLVQIVKHEWPSRWPTFIPELIESSKTSQSLCANNMSILQILSEDVFDFSSGQMTAEKMKELKGSLNKEFMLIFQLCEYILDNSMDITLLSTTLQTMQRFLHWIPVGYIFETRLVKILCEKFFGSQAFQNDTLVCLTEIGGLKLKTDEELKYNPVFLSLFYSVIQQSIRLITPNLDVAAIYAKGDNSTQLFIRHLSLFITSYLKAHLDLLESTDETSRQCAVTSLGLLLRISLIDDPVIFKICLEYWNILVVDLFQAVRLSGGRPSVFGSVQAAPSHPRVLLYAPVLSELRRVMIGKMAKPEEVVVVENERGEVVKERLADTDAVVLYKSMRECLVYLTHLDQRDTQNIMESKLNSQLDGTEWSWHNLNTLCWAIGAISNALTDEKQFLVRVIKQLLELVQLKSGKDHKAIIAANIMYVVGQYPQFLKQHWRFLRTVMIKLFEFMHETHPGVQDMSVDTFIKIVRKCKKKFIIVQQDESRPFIDEIVEQLSDTIRDLETPAQKHVFYEACADIIAGETNNERQQALIFKLMEIPNTTWNAIMAAAKHNQEVLYQPDTVKKLSDVLETNVHVAKSLGSSYQIQLSRIYIELLQVYKAYSDRVNQAIATEGEKVTAYAVIRSMRGIKKVTLDLVKEFVEGSSDADRLTIEQKFLPPLMELVLEDYRTVVPKARESEVLGLFASIVNKLGASISTHVPRIFDSVFSCTLDMIKHNFQEYPDHRIQFYALLDAIAKSSFQSLLQFTGPQFKLIIDSIVWAMRHIQREISETGLNILSTLIEQISRSTVANDFFVQFYVPLLSDILEFLTDTMHKFAFSMHAKLLAKLISIVDTGVIVSPLTSTTIPVPPPAGASSFPNNRAFVGAFMVTLLCRAFPTVNASQADQFVSQLFVKYNDSQAFKDHLRDFLVTIKEFSSANNEELYQEEKLRAEMEERKRLESVPGLLYEQPNASLDSYRQQRQSAHPSGGTI